jgi:hypothetical protein
MKKKNRIQEQKISLILNNGATFYLPCLLPLPYLGLENDPLTHSLWQYYREEDEWFQAKQIQAFHERYSNLDLSTKKSS